MNCIRHESTDILHYGALHFGSLRLQKNSRLLANWQLLDHMAKQQDGQFGKLLRQLGYA